jgi:hypothetical protein
LLIDVEHPPLPDDTSLPTGLQFPPSIPVAAPEANPPQGQSAHVMLRQPAAGPSLAKGKPPQVITPPSEVACDNKAPSAALQAQSEAHFANCGRHPRVIHVQQASSGAPGGADGKTPGVQDASVSGTEPGGAELPKRGAEPPEESEAGGPPMPAELDVVDAGLDVPTELPESGANPPPASRPPECPPHAQASTNMRDPIGDTPFVRVDM